jgi:hypothetical protein
MELVSRKDQIIKELAALDQKGIFSFVALTEKKALVKSRIAEIIGYNIDKDGVKTPVYGKINTPVNLTTVRKLMYATVSLGNNYQQAVNNRLKKEGKEADFKTQETYTEPVSENGILLKHKEKDQYYLRVYPNLCHSFTTVKKYFDVNDNEISEEEFKELEKKYFPLPGGGTKQGLEDTILVNNYKIENLLWLKRGDFVITDLSEYMIKLLKS